MLSKTAARRPAARLACIDRAASKSRHRLQASAANKQCKLWSAAAPAASKSARLGKRQEFTRAGSTKRLAAVSASRRPGASGPESKLARKSDNRPKIAAEKARNGSSRTG